MEYTVNVTKFTPFFDGDSLVSTHKFDDLDAAVRLASQSACWASSDFIEVIDENGRIHARWTSLYNFIYRFEDVETPDEYYNQSLGQITGQVEKHFIPKLSAYLNGREVSFIHNGEEMTFTVIPGTESIFFDACMDAGCEDEEAREEGIIDFPVIKTLMDKYSGELERRRQRYEKRKQHQLDLPY